MPFEFRHPSWYDNDILDLLRDSNVALCISDHHDAPSPWTVTARHVYLRGHGPGGRYRGHYPLATLQTWALRLERLRSDGHTIHVYLDNDQKSAAPKDALLLMKLFEDCDFGRRRHQQVTPALS